jgi:cytoskeletal protein CcmA (bactofilin family)
LAKKTGTSGFETIIGKNTILDGNIKTLSSMRIEGKISGNIDASGSVFIGRKAEIKGNINAENVFLCGAVSGNIRSTGLLKIQSTAKLLGDITVKSFVTDEGSTFQGSCSMIESTSVNNRKNDISNRKNKKKNRKESILGKIHIEEENTTDDI